MERSKQFEPKGIVPEKGKEASLLDELKEVVKEQIEKKTGVKAKLKTPVMHAAEDGTEKKEKGVVETILENPKAVRAGAAVTLAALRTWAEFWGSLNITPGFLKSEAEKKREKEIEERGWFGTFVDRASKYYEFGGKLQDAVLNGEWDELMKKKAKTKKGGGTPESKAA